VTGFDFVRARPSKIDFVGIILTTMEVLGTD
jgi:hypothetical protein